MGIVRKFDKFKRRLFGKRETKLASLLLGGAEVFEVSLDWPDLLRLVEQKNSKKHRGLFKIRMKNYRHFFKKTTYSATQQDSGVTSTHKVLHRPTATRLEEKHVWPKKAHTLNLKVQILRTRTGNGPPLFLGKLHVLGSWSDPGWTQSDPCSRRYIFWRKDDKSICNILVEKFSWFSAVKESKEETASDPRGTG